MLRSSDTFVLAGVELSIGSPETLCELVHSSILPKRPKAVIQLLGELGHIPFAD
jgi:hypothetical protein